MVSTQNGGGDIFETSLIPPPDICLRNVVTSRQYSGSNTREINLDCFRPDIYENNLKSQVARIEHHLKVVFAGKRCLNGKALLIVQQLFRNSKRLTASRDC